MAILATLSAAAGRFLGRVLNMALVRLPGPARGRKHGSNEPVAGMKTPARADRRTAATEARL